MMATWEFSFEETRRLAVSRDGALVTSALIAPPRAAIARPLGALVPELLCDLIDVATVIHAVDRLAPRRLPRTGAKPGVHRWCRRLVVHMPVRLPDRWITPEISQTLVDCLDYLTEDDWSFNFSQAPQVREPAVQRVLPFGQPTAVALFSGGLDSLAGLATEISKSEHEVLALLTVATSSRLLHRQRELLGRLVHQTPIKVLPIITPFRLSRAGKARQFDETSQRTRGFIFGSFAAATAMLAGADKVLVFENGVGAINLPLTPAQLGAQSTRSTHPLALRKLRRFLRLLFGVELQFVSPSLLLTKGKMCRRLAGSPLCGLAARTVSCDGFPSRIPGPEHCGVCSSCILRRLALWEAKFQDDLVPGLYRYDLLRHPEEVSPSRQLPLVAMLWQVQRMRAALNSTDPWASLTQEFPELAEAAEMLPYLEAGPQDSHQLLTRLYRRYCDEWLGFPSAGGELGQAA